MITNHHLGSTVVNQNTIHFYVICKQFYTNIRICHIFIDVIYVYDVYFESISSNFGNFNRLHNKIEDLYGICYCYQDAFSRTGNTV
jgi:hypothetical protein